MRKVITAEFDGCLRACVASIFELEPHTVPHFVREARESGCEYEWPGLLMAWLKPKGLSIVPVVFLSDHLDLVPDVYHIVITESGTKTAAGESIDHATVWRGNEMVWDPSGTWKRGDKEVQRVFFVVIDPCK